MPPVDGHGYRAAVLASCCPAARYRHHGMPGHAGDRAGRMPEWHVPAERGMIMTKHRQLSLLGQPGQQGLGGVDLDELVEMHRGRHSQGACHLIEQGLALLTPTGDGCRPGRRRHEWHLVRVDQQHVIFAQLGFSHRPLGGRLSLG